MKSFPLQHKKVQRLTMPYMHVGTCEIMNLATSYNMDSFNVFNRKNVTFYDKQRNTASSSSASAGALAPSFFGEMVGGGLLDSYAGRDASTFISNYLSRALSMHTVIPAELRALRKEDPANPLLDLMMAGLRRRSGMGVADFTSVMSEWDFQQYAMYADSAFFNACHVHRRASDAHQEEKAHFTSSARRDTLEGRGGGDNSGDQEHASIPAEETGCRGVWFNATVVPMSVEVQQRRVLAEQRQQLAPPPQKTLLSAEAAEERQVQLLLAQAPYCLDVTVGAVGNSRAFGVARNPLTEGSRSLLDPSRERTVPLSVDHNPLRTAEYRRIIQAGGQVDSAVGDVIDGNPFMNVSRSFGHWSMKNNAQRSPVQQKMIALPTVKTWRMLEGDALVLCNHAVFETRHQEDSSMDELAKLVGRGLSAGLPVEAMAASLCDFAVRFGSEHSLQVMVAVATKPEDGGAAASGPEYPTFVESIEPGPLYVGACLQFPELQHALELDCARCGVTLATLIRERWRRVRDLLPLRHRLSLLPFYGKECGVLQQVMEEEASFFAEDALQKATDPMDPQLDDVFRTLAKRLKTRVKRGGVAQN
ncbi:putative mitochondrial protein phosphatase 2C [Leptomonas pyrrhocoris]|uniref:Putative mitochondrial protein phosphatase 2C n=1 Tax=Leptomonas pyrrhocoris TaxID=157538 RepID=A0A0M9G126_LEPPY|nr:putative mitochondrial protein phosphatase 2C [Leptomonas pyrrhocoris]KPA80017.1 putative mitochondrial protein phosphatase 2C [Leptomonas pyrrhocoris]|eukprot:XP_015658456.1 putative mitochondrial protein phosphatase 2C [Leptomonas pyrrhocoris]